MKPKDIFLALVAQSRFLALYANLVTLFEEGLPTILVLVFSTLVCTFLSIITRRP